MHGAGEPKGSLVGQKKPDTANDHHRQGLTIVSVARESGLVYPNERDLFLLGSQPLSQGQDLIRAQQEGISFPHHVVGADRGLWLARWLRV